jgi:hypothetical protein
VAKKNPDALESYTVIYRGGLADLPKPKSGGIDMLVMVDSFIFEPSSAVKKWWNPLTIRFEAIKSFSVEGRQVSTVEGLLGGINSRQLNQDNNLHIDFTDENGNQVLLRLEMLSGITVMGQAVKARQLMDRLRVHGILDRIERNASPVASGAPGTGAGDAHDKLRKLAELHKDGILTDDEFATKKAELLSQL